MKRGIVLLMVSSVVLTGCWDRRELNEISITLGVGIDETEDGYLVTTQVVVPTEMSMKGGRGNSQVILYQSEAKTLTKAIQKIATLAPRNIYIGDLLILVISESLAEKGIGEILDYFSRNQEIRSDFFIVIARNMEAKDILNVTTAIDNIPANQIFNMIKTSEKELSSTIEITLDNLIVDIASEGKEAVLTGVEVFGDLRIGSSKENVASISPSAQIEIGDLGVFKKDKLVGWLSEKESRGYNEITNRVKRTVTTLSCPDGGTTAIDVIQFNSETKAKVINGKPELDIIIDVKGNISELNCQIDLTKTETISMLETIFNEELRDIMQTSITTSQKNYQADIFGFGEVVHRDEPNEWKKLKKNWNQEFTDLQVNIKVDSKISHLGAINNSFKLKDDD